ncbi:hypothetical protein CHS0354_012336, partial [Potamilus streckersoni]
MEDAAKFSVCAPSVSLSRRWIQEVSHNGGFKKSITTVDSKSLMMVDSRSLSRRWIQEVFHDGGFKSLTTADSRSLSRRWIQEVSHDSGFKKSHDGGSMKSLTTVDSRSLTTVDSRSLSRRGYYAPIRCHGIDGHFGCRCIAGWFSRISHFLATVCRHRTTKNHSKVG